MAGEPIALSDIISLLRAQLDSVERSLVLEWFLDHLPYRLGPSITTFSPLAGQPGTLIAIDGHRFSVVPAENFVEVGGKAALVVAASATQLKVLTADDVGDGAVKVSVAGRSATGPIDFRVLGVPNLGAGDDGPPVIFAGPA